MLSNMLIIDRARYGALQKEHRYYSVMQMMDFFIVKEENSTFTIIKNRHDGSFRDGLDEAALADFFSSVEKTVRNK